MKTTCQARTLHFAVGGALLAMTNVGTPLEHGCAEIPDVDEATLTMEEPPVIVNPGPIAPPPPPLTITAPPPAIINPGPVRPPGQMR